MSNLVARLRADSLDDYASATGAIPLGYVHLSDEAADTLEAKDKLIAELVEAVSEYKEAAYVLGEDMIVDRLNLLISKANHNRDRE